MNNINKTEKYYKKISFGISLQISLQDYEKIIEDYLPYLSSVYFSLPFGDEFHTRERVIKEYNQENAVEKLLEILKLFRKNGVKLEAVINQYHIRIEKIKEALNRLDKMIPVDSICCLDEYYDTIRNHYGDSMYIISSFNNQPLHKEILQKQLQKLKSYNMLVLSKEFMRDLNSLKKVKESNFDIKLLINNGCAFNCLSCREGNNKCKETFINNINKYSPEEMYAIQSFFPWELNKLLDQIEDNQLITEIKLSNRPCTYKYLNNCLKSYIYTEDEKMYINESVDNYHLWGRQSNLIPYYNKFDLDKINKIKKRLWQNKN